MVSFKVHIISLTTVICLLKMIGSFLRIKDSGFLFMLTIFLKLYFGFGNLFFLAITINQIGLFFL